MEKRSRQASGQWAFLIYYTQASSAWRFFRTERIQRGTFVFFFGTTVLAVSAGIITADVRIPAGPQDSQRESSKAIRRPFPVTFRHQGRQTFNGDGTGQHPRRGWFIGFLGNQVSG